MPNEITKLEFQEKRTQTSAIRRLLPTIEHYRKERKSLQKIYKALYENGEITLLYSSFRTIYYEQRDRQNSSESISGSDDSVKSFPNNFERLSPSQGELASSSDDVDVQETLAEVVPNSREIRIEDEDLATALARQQEEAEFYFNRK